MSNVDRIFIGYQGLIKELENKFQIKTLMLGMCKDFGVTVHPANKQRVEDLERLIDWHASLLQRQLNDLVTSARYYLPETIIESVLGQTKEKENG